MKKIWLLILIVILFDELKAQDAFFGLHRQNLLFSNPAYAGVEDKHVFSLSGRDAIENTYLTLLLTYDQPLRKIKSGISGVILYDRAGTSNLTMYYAGLCYKYNIKLKDKMNLGIGVQPAFVRKTVETQYLSFGSQYSPGIGYINSSPDELINSNVNYFDLDAGLWYSWDDFYLGISMKHIISPNIAFINDGMDHLYRNVIVTSGYTWKLGEHWNIIPSVLFMHQGPSNHLEFTGEVSLNETYFLGAGYRPTADASNLKICGGINFKKKIQVMLAYEFSSPGYLIPNWHGYETNLKYRFK